MGLEYGMVKRRTETLTQREKEVAQLIGEGLSSKQIAERLNVSIHTVTVFRVNIRVRLRVPRKMSLSKFFGAGNKANDDEKR